MQVATKQPKPEWTQAEHELAKRVAPFVMVGLKRAAMEKDGARKLSKHAAAVADLVAAAFMLGYVSARDPNVPPRTLAAS